MLVSLSVGLFAGYSSANIILNPGFEEGLESDATDWIQNGLGGEFSSSNRSDSMPASGNFSAYMQVDFSASTPSANIFTFEQVLPVGSIDNTQNYNLSFAAKVDSENFEGFNMFYQILWLDQDASDGGGVQGESLVQLIDEGINTSYQPFGRNDIDVPDGADSVQLRFQLSPGVVEGIVNGLYIDDVVLEPTTSQQAEDLNGDGFVDGLDLGILLGNFEMNGVPLSGGELNGTDPVDGLDLGILLGAWNPPALATATVPEPTSVALLACGGLALLNTCRRRRYSRHSAAISNR